MFDVITIGSAILDMFLKSSRFPLDKEMVGSKVEVDELLMSSGGGGTNSAAGFARLGLKTACVSRLGADILGQLVAQDLEKETFEKKFLIKKDSDSTDYSTILVNPDGSRTVLVYRGKTRLGEDVFPWEALNETRFLYISSLEGNMELLIKIVEKAVATGIRIVLNPGSRELKETERLKELFPKLKALILNKEEAESLGLTERPTDLETLVITDGRQGAKLYSAEKNLSAEAIIDEVVDETGAGDAFSVGLVTGLIKGWDLEKSLKLGLANGAAVVTKIGAKTALLSESEVEAWLGRSVKIEQIM